MTNKTPCSVIKHRENTEPGSHQMAKNGFPVLSSDRLVQNCVNLYIMTILHETASFYTGHCAAQPHRFSKSHRLL